MRRREVDYEAQAAIELEGLAVDEPDGDDVPYKIDLQGGDWARREPVRMSVAPLWQGLLKSLQDGVSSARIAAEFHASIADGFIKAAGKAREACGLRQVALSGGCMHNRRLARLLRLGLEREGFEVFQQRRVSPGDGGLSYGQAAVAAAILRSERG
jgi:hydrogenase maturation protein HypF